MQVHNPNVTYLHKRLTLLRTGKNTCNLFEKHPTITRLQFFPILFELKKLFKNRKVRFAGKLWILYRT